MRPSKYDVLCTDYECDLDLKLLIVKSCIYHVSDVCDMCGHCMHAVPAGSKLRRSFRDLLICATCCSTARFVTRVHAGLRHSLLACFVIVSQSFLADLQQGRDAPLYFVSHLIARTEKYYNAPSLSAPNHSQHTTTCRLRLQPTVTRFRTFWRACSSMQLTDILAPFVQ